MIVNLDDYDEYLDWCKANNYDSDTEYDREEAPYKRDINVCFCIKKLDSESYATVYFTQSYEWGASNFSIEEGFIRKEEQVVTTKVTYVKE
jgi:hypothetical protein